ncbi:MAG: hypothetical protein EON52_04165, partial [Actinomycetales bacterium]
MTGHWSTTLIWPKQRFIAGVSGEQFALPGLSEADDGPLFLPEVPYLRWIASTGEGLPAAIRDLEAIRADAAQVDEAILEQ